MPIDSFADSNYAILTLDSIERLIPWANTVRRQLEYRWLPEIQDCDNFARDWRMGVKKALARWNPDLEAEALCATIWVYNEFPWASVTDGCHALNMMPYYNTKTSTYGILVIEPQNGIYTDYSLYPNRDRIIQITISGG